MNFQHMELQYKMDIIHCQVMVLIGIIMIFYFRKEKVVLIYVEVKIEE
jgi:Mg2+ and Co2+ transporter CorA